MHSADQTARVAALAHVEYLSCVIDDDLEGVSTVVRQYGLPGCARAARRLYRIRQALRRTLNDLHGPIDAAVKAHEAAAAE